MLSIIALGLSLLALLTVSAFFSAAETAFTAASRTKMHTLEKEGDARAKTVNKLRMQSESLLGTILLGNNLTNILASSVTTTFFLAFFDEMGVVYATLLITFLTVVFAEFLPKSFAINMPDAIALKFSWVVNLSFILFSPMIKIAQLIVNGLLKIFGVSIENSYGAALGDDELRGAIDLHQDGSSETHHKRAMLKSILDLRDVKISEIMIHRQNVTMMSIDESSEILLENILKSQYTRIPLYEDDAENIVGVLHMRTLLRFLKKATGKIGAEDLRGIMTKPWFVPETTSLIDQLQAFRDRREHFAVVVDEFGSFMGIVTLEDILEEIVGQITDEYDEASVKIFAQDDGSYVVPGDYTIRDLNRDLHWDLPDDHAATLAGLILYEARDIPTPGQTFEFFGYRFTVLKREGNQITSIGAMKKEQINLLS